MKLSRRQLRQLINEELSRVIAEAGAVDLDKVSDADFLSKDVYAPFKAECLKGSPRLATGTAQMDAMLVTCIRKKAKAALGTYGVSSA